MHYLKDMIRSRAGNPQAGIYSCCSANRWVLLAVMRRAKKNDTHVLVESTANQVNQFGGYTGMAPADFRLYVERCARETGFPAERVILGGDHLGPLTWSGLPEGEAMKNAEELVREYVLAGFEKIHLDTSVRLKDDPGELDDAVIAARGARLCAVAERAWLERRAAFPGAAAPVYVIGSEVPVPGGMQDTHTVRVTSPEACRKTLSTYRSVFLGRGLEDAWERVVSLVVQPGVEFGNAAVCGYNSSEARSLTAVLADYPALVFEGHSTDYQTRRQLCDMVFDGIAILKVGPALTFTLREGLFALEEMERELLRDTGAPLSNFRAVLEQAMLSDDSHWKRHCKGAPARQALERAFGFSDRARYYLPVRAVSEAVDRLIRNLRTTEAPLYLLNQYMPGQYRRVREGTLPNNVKELLLDHIGDTCDDYLAATGRLKS